LKAKSQFATLQKTNIMEKIKRRKPRPDAWTSEEIKLLKKHYPVKDNDTVAALVGKSVRAIRAKAQVLKVKKSTRYWDKPDEDYLIKNWPVMSAVEIGQKLAKTKWAIINKYRELTGKR
jgi:hypothetical protein